MSKPTAKQQREFKLFEKLQAEHGYTLMDACRGMEKTQLMFDRTTKKMSVAIVMRLAVPADSAIGKSMAAYRERSKPATGTKRARRSPSR